MPETFVHENERDYWHMSQDIAYRAGLSLIERDGASWLVGDDSERLICERTERLWFETWRILDNEFGRLSRQWVGGRPLNNPGE